MGSERFRKFLTTGAIHILLIMGVMISMFLLFWLVCVSIKPVRETYSIPITILPRSLTLDNFRQALFEMPLVARYYANGLIVTLGAVGSILLISALAGYAFARLQFPGRDFIFWIMVGTIFFPYTVSLPALYQLLYSFRLTDTLLGLILPYTALWLRLGTLIMRQVFLSIPREIEEAAIIDGCSRFGAFWRVLLPLVTNGWVVVGIFTFVPIWGEFMLAYTITSSPKSMPISIGMKMLQPDPAFGEWTLPVATSMALAIFIPSLVIFIIFQKWFARGLTAGALKF